MPTSPARRAPGPTGRPASPSVRLVAGVLADGTAHYAPVGVVRTDGDRVACHLCGRWFRSLPAHLPAHGWDAARYRAAFGLEAGQPLEAAATRARRAAAFVPRLVFEPAVREGARTGRARARAGELARDAADAARGRPHPPQRRAKTLAALAAVDPARVAAASTARGRAHRAAVAASAAARVGAAGLGEHVLRRRAAGVPLAAVERECGLPKDWLSKHLAAVDPAAAAAVRVLAAAVPAAGSGAVDWPKIAAAQGFPDVVGYLRDRHAVRGWTVARVAAEAGVSRGAVAGALRTAGLDREPHAASRRAAADRDRSVAARFGFPDVAAYVGARLAAGRSWAWVAAECGQPQSWLRRRCAAAARPGPAAPPLGHDGGHDGT